MASEQAYDRMGIGVDPRFEFILIAKSSILRVSLGATTWKGKAYTLINVCAEKFYSFSHFSVISIREHRS